ncbi:hypothetical protein PROFUN_15711 [Planoprotostelium fungivorum]|uniref:Uncharacterized protein n=1 Tax=Planoprotostelium fungivorum TaxID=1890364 RepID=A0A2P6MUN1_9EUKA|nr:hypothetical protein PROFUN_15711 [Planoprotostelium fungivorum]
MRTVPPRDLDHVQHKNFGDMNWTSELSQQERSEFIRMMVLTEGISASSADPAKIEDLAKRFEETILSQAQSKVQYRELITQRLATIRKKRTEGTGNAPTVQAPVNRGTAPQQSVNMTGLPLSKPQNTQPMNMGIGQQQQQQTQQPVQQQVVGVQGPGRSWIVPERPGSSVMKASFPNASSHEEKEYQESLTKSLRTLQMLIIMYKQLSIRGTDVKPLGAKITNFVSQLLRIEADITCKQREMNSHYKIGLSPQMYLEAARNVDNLDLQMNQLYNNLTKQAQAGPSMLSTQNPTQGATNVTNTQPNNGPIQHLNINQQNSGINTNSPLAGAGRGTVGQRVGMGRGVQSGATMGGNPQMARQHLGALQGNGANQSQFKPGVAIPALGTATSAPIFVGEEETRTNVVNVSNPPVSKANSAIMPQSSHPTVPMSQQQIQQNQQQQSTISQQPQTQQLPQQPAPQKELAHQMIMKRLEKLDSDPKDILTVVERVKEQHHRTLSSIIKESEDKIVGGSTRTSSVGGEKKRNEKSTGWVPAVFNEWKNNWEAKREDVETKQREERNKRLKIDWRETVEKTLRDEISRYVLSDPYFTSFSSHLETIVMEKRDKSVNDYCLTINVRPSEDTHQIVPQYLPHSVYYGPLGDTSPKYLLPVSLLEAAEVQVKTKGWKDFLDVYKYHLRLTETLDDELSQIQEKTKHWFIQRIVVDKDVVLRFSRAGSPEISLNVPASYPQASPLYSLGPESGIFFKEQKRKFEAQIRALACPFTVTQILLLWEQDVSTDNVGGG